MEIRTLKYFLAVVEEGNISHAAKRLHVTQPTLSRQLASLEDELGRQLYTRGHAGIALTEHGVMLARYAESIVGLADKAAADVSIPAKTVSGPVHIAAGETKLMVPLVEAMKRTHAQYPEVTFQLYSGTTADLMDGLVRGRYDFLLECELGPHVDMNVIEFAERDAWGLVMRADDPLAALDVIHPEDLLGRDLITSRQGTKSGPLREWLGDLADEMSVVATYGLGMNSKWMIRDGFGVAFAYDQLLVTRDNFDLVWRPLEPRIESVQGLVWRKALPTRQAQVFLDALREVLKN